jgi:uncharacterized protein (TIGR04255 family)
VKAQPLTGGPPEEVPLPSAPLVRVIAQIKFAPILAIRIPDRTAAFQETVRDTYPILREERSQIIASNPGGMPDVRDSLIWRFTNREKQPDWRLSLGVDFLALETSSYVSRTDLLERMEIVLRGLEKSFKPSETKRLGLRYIDRLTGDALQRIAKLIQPQILGIGLPSDEPSNGLNSAIIHLMTEAAFLADEGQIRARWGSLPENATYDQFALEPIEEASWILDLDIFTPIPQLFVTEELLTTTRRFAERVYSVFREMVTDEFLSFYGGEI